MLARALRLFHTPYVARLPCSRSDSAAMLKVHHSIPNVSEFTPISVLILEREYLDRTIGIKPGIQEVFLAQSQRSYWMLFRLVNTVGWIASRHAACGLVVWPSGAD